MNKASNISCFFDYDDIRNEIIESKGDLDEAGFLAAVKGVLERAVDAGILERDAAEHEAQDIAALFDIHHKKPTEQEMKDRVFTVEITPKRSL